MDQHLKPNLFPAGFPADLADAALVDSGEAAWRPTEAAASIQWLGEHGFAVLGTEVFLPLTGGMQSLPYFQDVDRKPGEPWSAFVARAAAETLCYLTSNNRNFDDEGNVFVNITWISEAEFQNELLRVKN